jgi:pimeloyl-ACP methyl ester carboxylesterase
MAVSSLRHEFQGQSDGGIIALLLAIHHPDKVGMLAIMGGSCSPMLPIPGS